MNEKSNMTTIKQIEHFQNCVHTFSLLMLALFNVLFKSAKNSFAQKAQNYAVCYLACTKQPHSSQKRKLRKCSFGLNTQNVLCSRVQEVKWCKELFGRFRNRSTQVDMGVSGHEKPCFYLMTFVGNYIECTPGVHLLRTVKKS